MVWWSWASVAEMREIRGQSYLSLWLMNRSQKNYIKIHRQPMLEAVSRTPNRAKMTHEKISAIMLRW